MPTPFREEHDHFRKTVRQFAEKELAPFADEWEAAEIFPNEVFKRAGELGVFSAHYPEEHGGAGGDYWFSVAKAAATTSNSPLVSPVTDKRNSSKNTRSSKRHSACTSNEIK